VDNATHTLFALTLARTSLGRAGRGTTMALVIASNAPDIDFVTTVGGAGSYLTWHRGPTHGPLGVLGLGVMTAALVWGTRHLLHSIRRNGSAPPNIDVRQTTAARNARPPENVDAPLRLLIPIAMLGVLFHVLLDLPTSYGTRLLSPFDWRWFTLDWMPIVDVYLLTALATGLVIGTISPAAGRRNAAMVLALVAANSGVRAVAHDQALAQAPRLFGPRLPPLCEPQASRRAVIDHWPRERAAIAPVSGRRCLIELVALPSFRSPFKWRVVAHLTNAYELHDVDLLDRRLRRPPEQSEALWRRTVYVRNVWTPSVFAAASTDAARAFLGFARLPAVVRATADSAGGVTVQWTDLRFGAPFAPTDRPVGRTDLFTVAVRVAPDGQHN
jgi:inner membrane protein